MNDISQKNIGQLYGLINGGVAIVFTLILYFIGVNAFLSMFTWVGVALMIAVSVMGGLQKRKLQGDYIEFGEALKLTFTILVLGSLLNTIFEYILMNFLDVPFRQALAQATADKAEQMMERFGMPESQIDKATEQILNGNTYSAGSLFLSFAFRCIGWFIVALIVSAIIKRKRPPFDNSFNP